MGIEPPGRPKVPRPESLTGSFRQVTVPAAGRLSRGHVVCPDGGLGGYRWGVQRKQALLAQEQAASRQPANGQAEAQP
jgi:hypothetical protein